MAQLQAKVYELVLEKKAREQADDQKRVANAEKERARKETDVALQKLVTTEKTAAIVKRHANAEETARKKREAEEKAKLDAQRKKIDTAPLK